MLSGAESPAILLIDTLNSFNNSTLLTTTLNPFDNSTSMITTISPAPEIVQIKEEIRIHWPFLIIGVYNILVLIAFGVVYYMYPDNQVHPSRITSTENEDDNNKKKDSFHLKKPLEGNLKTAVIIISTLAMHAYVGLEISFGSLLPPFAVYSDLHMTKPEGSFVTSTYWGMYTFLRVFSLIAIIYFSPRFLLLVDFGIILISNVILVPFANHYRWALWLGKIFFDFI